MSESTEETTTSTDSEITGSSSTEITTSALTTPSRYLGSLVPEGCGAVMIAAGVACALLAVAIVIATVGTTQPQVQHHVRTVQPEGGVSDFVGGGSGTSDVETATSDTTVTEEEPVVSTRRHAVKRSKTRKSSAKAPKAKKAKRRRTTRPLTTVTSTAAAPMRLLVRQPLLCTVGRYARASTLYPEDGLCDFIFCPVALQEDLQFESFGDAFIGFRERAAGARKTQHGIDIKVSTMNTTLDRLHTDEGAAAFRSLWDGNIRQHSVLYPVLYNGVKSSYVNTLIGLLNTLRGLQMRFRTNEEVLPSHIFVGIAVLHRGSDDYKNVEKYFNKVIKVTSPDVLVLRTHYVQKDDGNRDCHVTGPAIWQGKFSADQPAFLESLRFLQKVTIPDYLAIVLSFTEASRWYRWDANDSSFVLGEKCVVDFHTDLFPRSMLCNGTPGDGQSYASKHRQTQQMYAVQNRNSYGLVFDNKDTIRTKMCWTSTSFKYKIGWAMFDLEFADTANACRDPTYTKGFALLHWMKHYMRNGFHEASECEPF